MSEIGPVCVVVLGERVDAEATAQEHAQAYGFSVLRVHTNGVRGYSARLPQASLAMVARDPRVRRFQLDAAAGGSH
jgi:hypothetical protein